MGRTCLDPQVYLTALMLLCSNVAFSSLPVFLPLIIRGMGYSGLTSQALSAPPYLVAFIAVLTTAWASDRYGQRSRFVIFHALLAAAGYAWMAIAGWRKAPPLVRYIGVFPATIGFFSAVTIIITWNVNNQQSTTERGTGLSILNYIGQLGPLIGTSLYSDQDAPYYVPGMTYCTCFMLTVAILAGILRRILLRRNARTFNRSQEKGKAVFRYII